MRKPRRSINRLQLGPIVGHTDATTTRIWIQVFDDPGLYSLRIKGVGSFQFFSTELPAAIEFGTAIAKADGLRPDRIYSYQVYRRGRFIPRSRGRLRTMPDPSSMSDIVFSAISCNSLEVDGEWERFATFVDESQPRFLLMMGDQVYLDDDKPDVFDEHFESRSSVRRKAMAEKYRLNWQREPVRRVLTNVPTYMIWDDHDIRDGWGSFAPDSPTLAAKFPVGHDIHVQFNAYFEDARDVYWHFQGCRNPPPATPQDPLLPNYFSGPTVLGDPRRAMPYVLRCGRIVVLVLDSRGERDVFRDEYPILGTRQWEFIEQVFDNLPADVEALAVVTSTPIASMDPEGQAQKVFGERTDDVERFKRGDLDGLVEFKASDDFANGVLTALNPRISRLTGQQQNLGGFKRGAIDEARDQWSHRFSRPEQEQLIRKAGAARLTNRVGAPRSLLFLSGDIHVGGIYDIVCAKPKFKAVSLISSGISKESGSPFVLGIFLDEDFDVAPGIRSKLRHVVNTFNFSMIHMIPTGAGAQIKGAVAHQGTSLSVGVDLTDLL